VPLGCASWSAIQRWTRRYAHPTPQLLAVITAGAFFSALLSSPYGLLSRETTSTLGCAGIKHRPAFSNTEIQVRWSVWDPAIYRQNKYSCSVSWCMLVVELMMLNWPWFFGAWEENVHICL
jgi:hypothetical protein